jgi:hypothetical protein
MVKLQARLSVATWDGREEEAPAGADRPRVHSWTTSWVEALTETCTLNTPIEVTLAVTPVPDTVTDIAVTGTAVGAST